MKSIPFVLLIAFAAVGVHAAEGTRIVLTTRAMPTLPAGTHVRVEMTAEYSLLQPPEAGAPKPGAGPKELEVTDDMIKYRLAAKGRVIWDFTVPANGKVPAETFTLQFPRLLPAAPSGMAAGITFPMHYRAVVPGENGPVVIERRSEFGMSYEKPSSVITRCIRIKGSSATTIGMGVLPDCDVDPRKLPGARVTAQ